MRKNIISMPLGGDLIGAFTAAAINLPLAIGYSITAFSAFGSDFLPQAVIIGVNSVIISCFITALLSGTPTLISGTSGPLTIVMITIIGELKIVLTPYVNSQNQVTLILVSAALCLVAGGLFQTILGYFRIGSLTKYVPYPVISGFINGIAISLILHQLPTILGMAGDQNPADFMQIMQFEHLTAFLVGGITIGGVFTAKKYFPKLSPPLFGLTVGVSLYYSIFTLFKSANVLPIVGKITIGKANTVFIGATVDALNWELIGSILPEVLFFGMIICLVSSIETLMSSSAIGYRTGQRFDSNRDLMGQGLGNIIASLFSIMPSSGSLVRSVANINTGGETRWSGIFCSLFILLVFVFAHPFIGKIPLTVLSGVIIAISLSLLDGYDARFFFKALKAGRFTRELGLNFMISLTVTVLTVAVDLTWAIIVGVLITTAVFVVKTGKSVIRRKYRCNQMHSKRVRNMEQTRYLEENGTKILVIELQGPLFFGSAEEVSKEIDTSNGGSEYIIINMKRVSEIDITGTKCLLQIHGLLGKKGKTLLISHMWEGHKLWQAFVYADAISIIGKDHIFPDIDCALEYAENKLLYDGPGETSDKKYRLAEMDILSGFTDEEIKIVKTRLNEETYGDGEVIIRQGDRDRDLYLLLQGIVSAKLKFQNKSLERRLNSISAGVAFGEIALLDNKPRSADIVADGDVVVCKLPYGQFLDLQKSEPLVANKLILNIALILSTRIRLSTNEIQSMLEV